MAACRQGKTAILYSSIASFEGSAFHTILVFVRCLGSFQFAGLYDAWTSNNGEKMHSFTIITAKSRSTLRWLHDRMPARDA